MSCWAILCRYHCAPSDRMISLEVRVLLTLLLMTTTPLSAATSSPEKHDLERVSVYTDVLCPYNVICREGESRLPVRSSDRTGCCTDCSCADDCGLLENCCYPHLDRYKLVDRSHQRCIYPTTNQLQDGTAYNVVVDGYPDGTGDECETAGVKCGDDKTASRLGAVYPVFSPKTGRIYVNMKCARCHGLNDSDVVVWKAYLACDENRFIDVSTYFQYFADGFMTSSCTFKFVYPGQKSDLQTEQCHRGTDIHVSTCGSNLQAVIVPDGLNMTRDEIVQACKSDLISPVLSGVWYKNVFCRLCVGINIDYMYMYNRLRTCSKVENVDGRRMLETSFLALIEPEVSDRSTADIQSQRPVDRIACSVTNETDCRLAYCPSGKIPNAQGQCRYVSQRWRTGPVGVYVKLFPRQPVTLATAGSIDFEAVLANPHMSVSPWSSSWSVERFLSFPRTDAENVTHVEYFLVRLKFDKEAFNFNKVISGISDVIKQDWLLLLNDSLMSHRQEFSDYTRFYEPSTNSNRTSSPETYYLFTHEKSPSFMRSIPVPEYEILYRKDDIKPFSVVITNMFFCDQVLLRPEEYQMDTFFIFAQLNATGRILYPNEIAVAPGDELESAPKVCCHDVGFHVVSPTTGAASRLAARGVWWLVVIGTLFSSTSY